MPVVSAPNPEVDQSVTRPVVLDIVRQVMEMTNIPLSTPITYVGQGEARSQFGSNVDIQEETTKLASSHMVTIEVEERFNASAFASNSGHRPDQLPDFLDNKLGVLIKPVYTVCDFDVVFTYRTPSRNEALRWRDDAHFKASQSRDVNLHEGTYHYLLPNPFWTLLRHIYDLREAQGGYNESWDVYLANHLTTRATQIVNGDASVGRTAIRETQGRIQGYFDFQEQPEKQEKNQEKGAWEIKFTYSFSFSKPISSSIRYPVVVHNQLIDEKFIPFMPNDTERQQARASLTVNALHYFEAAEMQRRLLQPVELQKSPSYDEWTPDTPVPNTTPFLSLLSGIDPASATTTIMNLTDLGDYVIDTEVLDFLKAGEHVWLNKPNTSLMQVSVYKNEHLINHNRFTVEANLDVKLNEALDIRSTYRVVVSFCNDITAVIPLAIKRVLPFTSVLQKLVRLTRPNASQLRRLIPLIDIEALFPDLQQGGYTRQDILDAIVSRKTVMISHVEAYPR